jgi:uncharacterized membrane protein
MNRQHSPAFAAIPRHPLHATLVPFPIVCFTLTLLTDIAYWQTSNVMWMQFSQWLLLTGLVFGVVATIAGVVDFLVRREARASRQSWVHAVGGVIVLVLAFFNSLVHTADGWTAVVPYGLILSAATVLVMILTDWFGRALVYRQGVGVSRS